MSTQPTTPATGTYTWAEGTTKRVEHVGRPSSANATTYCGRHMDPATQAVHEGPTGTAPLCGRCQDRAHKATAQAPAAPVEPTPGQWLTRYTEDVARRLTNDNARKTYTVHATRFARWAEAHPTATLREALARYTEDVEARATAEATKRTYTAHAARFVRWTEAQATTTSAVTLAA